MHRGNFVCTLHDYLKKYSYSVWQQHNKSVQNYQVKSPAPHIALYWMKYHCSVVLISTELTAIDSV